MIYCNVFCCDGLSGEAQAILAKAEAKSRAIKLLSEALAEQVIPLHPPTDSLTNSPHLHLNTINKDDLKSQSCLSLHLYFYKIKEINKVLGCVASYPSYRCCKQVMG